jgi:hypothetical protein
VQHDRRRIIGEEGRHHHADAVEEQEEAFWRPVGMVHRKRRDPVEQSLPACDLREQHHADQEEVDVEPLAHRAQSVGQRQQAEDQERDAPQNRPDGLRPVERANQDACRGQRGYGPYSEIG